MTIVGAAILVLGFSVSISLLSFSVWLWTRGSRPGAPVSQAPPPPAPAPPPAPPPAPTANPRAMTWAVPGDRPSLPSSERTAFEQSVVEPLTDITASPDIDKAKTMFFMKKRGDPDKTQILLDGADAEAPGRDADAPAPRLEQMQTAPKPRAQAPAKPRVPRPPQLGKRSTPAARRPPPPPPTRK